MHTILLLEDDENLNRGITITLQKAGYNVLSAFTLSEAKKYLALEAENISLVICDITLPDGNGLDFGKRVREASSIYLIYLSSCPCLLTRIFLQSTVMSPQVIVFCSSFAPSILRASACTLDTSTIRENGLVM